MNDPAWTERPTWFACQEERPSDLNTVWHGDCEGCRVKARAEIRQAQEDPQGERAQFFFYFGSPALVIDHEEFT